MSSSNNFSDFSISEMEALSLWHLPEIPKPGAPVKEKSPSIPQMTVDEIEAMQKQAYDEAFVQGKADGYQQGFSQGQEEGAKQGYDENVELLTTKAALFNTLMESLSEPFKKLDEAVEKELVSLAIAMANQIIRREIKMDPGQVIAAVREAIQVLPLSSQKITLYLHPEDAELVRSVMSIDDMSPPWNVVEDPLLTRGGCKVDTEVSHINATVESRLAAVVATVLGGEREQDKTQ